MSFPPKISPLHGNLDLYLIHASLGPPEAITQTVSHLVRLSRFCTAHVGLLHVRVSSGMFPLKIATSHGWIRSPSTSLFLGSTRHSIVSKTAFRSVQPFLQRSRQIVPILYNEHPFPQKKITPSHWVIWTPPNAWFLLHIQAYNPNGAISIGSAVFAMHNALSHCGRPTDHATARSVTIGRIYSVRSTTMRPKINATETFNAGAIIATTKGNSLHKNTSCRSFIVKNGPRVLGCIAYVCGLLLQSEERGLSIFRSVCLSQS